MMNTISENDALIDGAVCKVADRRAEVWEDGLEITLELIGASTQKLPAAYEAVSFDLPWEGGRLSGFGLLYCIGKRKRVIGHSEPWAYLVIRVRDEMMNFAAQLEAQDVG